MIEIDLPNGRTIYTPNKEIAQWTLSHIHCTLNDVNWREVDSRPDSDGPQLMSPNATVSEGKVLYQNGRELIFESIAILEYYVTGMAEGFPGDMDSLRASLESPDVDVDSLVSA